MTVYVVVCKEFSTPGGVDEGEIERLAEGAMTRISQGKKAKLPHFDRLCPWSVKLPPQFPVTTVGLIFGSESES